MASKLTPQQRLDRLHVSLLRNESTLIMSGILMMGKSEITDHPDIPTACTDGVNKMYDEKFFMAMEDSEARTVVVHENLHVMFKHIHVWKHLWEEDARTANMAADYVVNGFINKLDPTETFLKPPRNRPPGMWLCDKKFDGMDVGEVYRLLRKEKKSGEGEGEGEGQGQGGQMGGKPGANGGSGGAQMDGLDAHDWKALDSLSQKEIEELGKEIDQAIRQGSIVAGKVSAKRDRTFDALMEPVIDWKKALREFVTSNFDGRDESTWRRPNRRWLQYDMYMPSMQGVATGGLVLAIDTSGSTYVGGMLEKFLSEMNAVTLTAQPEKVDLLYWESDVAAHEVYTREELGGLMARTKPKGGGGTTTSCVTRYMDAQCIKPKAAIVFTDGHLGNDYGGQWPCPLLWCVVGNKSFSPPTGMVLHVD
jgi:predicted metal-dependent peptidase